MGMLGLIAEQRGVRVRVVVEEFGGGGAKGGVGGKGGID